MRILFLTQYYPPETGAAPLRAYHFATKLAKKGHDITVLTGMPNHPSGIKQPGFSWKLVASSREEGVRILRSYLFTTHRKTFLTRMLNQISFAVSAFFRGCFAPGCDVILVTSPPLFLGVTGWMLGHVKAAPYVLDVRDYWPHAAVALGQLRSRRVIALAERMELFLYTHAAWIVAVTPGMRRLMVKRGIPEHRVVLIPNGADTDCFTPPTDQTPSSENGKWTVLYSGTHGLVHGMESILDAAEELLDDERVRFVMVGDGVAKDALVEDAGRRNLSNVEFLPSQQPKQLAQRIRSADVCIATTTAGTFSEGTIPVKMFDYMACGKPVIAAVAGDARTIVAEADGGVVVAPGDSSALATAVRELLKNEDERHRLGKNGHDYVKWSYSRQHLAGRMNDLLERVTRREEPLGGGSLSFRRYLSVKYAIDAVIAFVLLVATLPLMALLAVVIKLDSPGPVIYVQRRAGVYSQCFTMYKFRTMHIHTPELATDLLAPTVHDYTTRSGRIMRRLSLDELPNLWNILMGDMSIVGPRPALHNQYELIDDRRKVGGDVMRPGLTGWAQINGRDSITQDEKVRLDEFYARSCSLTMDLRIVLGTIGAVSRREDGSEIATEPETERSDVRTLPADLEAERASDHGEEGA